MTAIVAAVVPVEQSHLPALWAFCSSPDFEMRFGKLMTR